MTRNLSYRVEAAFPIYNEILKQEIIDFLKLQLSDNVKARIIDESYSNKYVKTNTKKAIRSQLETYFKLQQKVKTK